MQGIEHATPGIIIIMGLIFAIVFYYMRFAKTKADQIHVRRIPGVDAIDEAVGRSAELGRPISFSTGLTLIGPLLYACLGVLYYVARKASVYKSKLLVPQVSPETMAVVEDTMRDAYRDSGRSSGFDPQNIVFLSEEQFAFASGYMGMVHREKVASTFLFGKFAGEALVLAEAGQQVSAMQIAACATPEQVPFFVCTCDYTIIGEEIFAASTYLSREQVQLGSIAGQDRLKLLFLALIFLGVVIATINSINPKLSLPNIDNLVFNADWILSRIVDPILDIFRR
jgi:hypothetical protein